MGFKLFSASDDFRPPSGPKLINTSSEPTVTTKGGYDYSTPPPAPEPDPKRFRIVDTEEINGWTLAVVHYPACTTYGGHKLLVYPTTANLVKAQKILDPHFLEADELLTPVARFEPTDEGIELARLVCRRRLRVEF